MFEIYLCTALILAASLLLGAAILTLLGWPRPLWLAGATGFAALVLLSPFLIRLPGRATTAAALIGLLLILAVVILRRARVRGEGEAWWTGALAALIVVALASLPFFFQDRIGALGTGIYTNDHAAQLYWAEWLQHGFGPEPSAVAFGYPIGPQALTAIAAQVTGADLIAAFNGLLLAIPALSALAALGALGELPPARRVAIAVLAALPYLAASFLAQSAFKETTMALLVLAFAVALQSLRTSELPRFGNGPRNSTAAVRGAVPGRAVVGVGLVLAAASVFTFSIPGLAWFAVGVPLWLVFEALAGRSPIDFGAIGSSLRGHRVAAIAGAAVLLAVAIVAIGPATSFVDKINEVQQSAGRLSSPIFPGEALGIWPEGDFRIVRGEVSGALLAAALGFAAVLYGAWFLFRRRQLALLAMLIAGGIVYVGARLFAQIHVEAKALAVIAPLVLLVGLRALFSPDERARSWRYAAGVLVALAALGSTLLALRAAPVGPNERGEALEALGERIQDDSVVFLGVDRFAGYRLRGTLARAPAGYVPEEIHTRPEKPWFQGYAVDFDNLDPGQLDKFDYAITTTSAYNSIAPPNFEPVAEEGGYVLWQRSGETPRSRIIGGEKLPVSDPLGAAAEANSPGAVFPCSLPANRRLAARGGSAVVRPRPVGFPYTDWQGITVETAAAGQERAYEAGTPVSLELGDGLGDAAFELSLQYHSQVPLTVLYNGEEIATLPATLDGMYLDGAGRGAFWPVAEVQGEPGSVVEIATEEPGGLRGTLGVGPRFWLGNLVATPAASSSEVAIGKACRRYVDHFTLKRGAQP